MVVELTKSSRRGIVAVRWSNVSVRRRHRVRLPRYRCLSVLRCVDRTIVFGRCIHKFDMPVLLPCLLFPSQNGAGPGTQADSLHGLSRLYTQAMPMVQSADMPRMPSSILEASCRSVP